MSVNPPGQPVGGGQAPPTSSWVPRFLLEPSLRLYCLRAAILLGIIDAWFFMWLYRISLEVDVLALVSAVVVIVAVVHHFAIALGPRLLPLPVWVDLGLTTAEAGYSLMLCARLILMRGDTLRFRWFPKRDAFGYAAFFGFTVSLVLLFILKIVHLASSPGGTSWRRVELGHVEYKKVAWWKYGAQALFGRKPWEEKLPGEPRSIRFTRGILTLCIIIMVIMFAANEVVLKPVAEMGMTPNREFRAQKIEGGFKTSSSIVWNLVLVWPTHLEATGRLIDAAEAQVLSAEGPQASVTCKKTARPDLNGRLGYPGAFEIVVFGCARRLVSGSEEIRDLWNGTDRSYLSNILLSVNFFDLLGGFGPLNDQDVMFEALQVFIGLTEDARAVTRTTRSIPVFPGVNLLSVANLIIRQRLKPAELSTLGFDMHNTFFVADVKYTIPNPYLEDHWNTTNRVLSTLRIVPEWGMTEWVVVQDYRSKSVLTGLSAVGGLGSLLGTLLVIILGTSLMRTLRGSKPYSPFGILHNFGSERMRIRDECLRKYPAMRAELAAYQSSGSQSRAGVAAFLLDTLFDGEVLGFQGNPDHTSLESERVGNEDQWGPRRVPYNPYTLA